MRQLEGVQQLKGLMRATEEERVAAMRPDVEDHEKRLQTETEEIAKLEAMIALIRSRGAGEV